MSTRLYYVLTTPSGRFWGARGVEQALDVYRSVWRVPKPVGPMSRAARLSAWFKRIVEVAPMKGHYAGHFRLAIFRLPRGVAPGRNAFLKKCEEFGRHITPDRPQKRKKKKVPVYMNGALRARYARPQVRRAVPEIVPQQPAAPLLPINWGG